MATIFDVPVAVVYVYRDRQEPLDYREAAAIVAAEGKA
jgi:hypothetical protein